MGNFYPHLTKTIARFFAPIFILFLLISCNAVDMNPAEKENLVKHNQILQEELEVYVGLEEELSSREAAISKREAELVTLFIDLLKKEKSLDIGQAEFANKQKQILAELKAKESSNSQRNIAARNLNSSHADSKSNRIVLGGLEKVFLDPPNLVFNARIDTGAKTSSLNAIDMVEFERDGKPYIKFNVIHPETGENIELTRRIRRYVRIKEHMSESQRRPVVRLRVKFANIDERIYFTLVDRSKFAQQVLIGRNLLQDLAIVDVSKKFTAQSANISDHETK